MIIVHQIYGTAGAQGRAQPHSYNLNKMYGKKDTNDGDYPQETDPYMKIVCRKSTKDML
jgi:hypothetical protein